MPKSKRQSGRLSVFKGREAKLNKAIFDILALKGPQTLYGIAKEVRLQKHLKRKLYSVVNRRVRALEQLGYVETAGTREAKDGFRVTVYQLSQRGYLVIVLDQIDLNWLIEKTDAEVISDLLRLLTSQLERWKSRPRQ